MSIHRETDPRHRLIVALDTSDENEALRLADSLRPDLRWVKIGLQLFVGAGPRVVRRVVSMGYRVFLDLKLHDIPNTMAGGIESLADLGVRLTTVHAGSGAGVGAAARAAAEAPPGPDGSRVGVLAVTVLTSHGEDELLALYGSRLSHREMVASLGRSAVTQGAAGLVASPLEIGLLRDTVGNEPLLVIPGIRPAGAALGDQARVATPAQALRDGADFLVMGRPITQDPVPRNALRRVLDEMASAD